MSIACQVFRNYSLLCRHHLMVPRLQPLQHATYFSIQTMHWARKAVISSQFYAFEVWNHEHMGRPNHAMPNSAYCQDLLLLPDFRQWYIYITGCGTKLQMKFEQVTTNKIVLHPTKDNLLEVWFKLNVYIWMWMLFHDCNDTNSWFCSTAIISFFETMWMCQVKINVILNIIWFEIKLVSGMNYSRKSLHTI